MESTFKTEEKGLGVEVVEQATMMGYEMIPDLEYVWY